MTQRAPEGSIKTVLFDAGGVLLDLDYGYIRRLLEARGHEVSKASLSRAEAIARTEIERRVREGGKHSEAWRDYFRILFAEVKFDKEHFESVIDSLWEAHNRVGMWTVPIAGALDTVQHLKESGYRLGVVSNAEGRVARDLETAGYKACFDTVVDSHKEGVEKPDPKIFQIALERMEAEPATTVFIGDVPSIDIEGAKSAGLRAVLLDRHDLYSSIDVPRLHALKDFPKLLSSMA